MKTEKHCKKTQQLGLMLRVREANLVVNMNNFSTRRDETRSWLSCRMTDDGSLLCLRFKLVFKLTFLRVRFRSETK